MRGMATVILNPRQEAPSDLPLVLLAPFPFRARVWEHVAALVGGDVITVAPPGFGGETDDAPGLEGYARAVLAALDARGVRRFVVAGNSMGGYAAMCLADLAPERVAGLGLLGTKSTADAAEAAAGRRAMADAADAGTPVDELLAPMHDKFLGASTRASRPDLVAEVDRYLAAVTPAGVAWAQRAMEARPDRTEVLRGLSLPAVVVYGVEDAFMPPESQPIMAEALGVGVIEIESCGHLLPLEAPEASVQALRELWDAARSSAGSVQ